MKQFVLFLLAAAFISTVGLGLFTASSRHSVDAVPEEKQKAGPSIMVDVTSKTKLAVDQILITHHANYSMLRVRCRWVGENISEDYVVRPSLDGIGHKESTEGSVWYSAMTKSPTDQRPGFPFTLDIKNPPTRFETLPFKIVLKQRADRWWVDVPRLNPVSFSIDRHDVDIQPFFQMRVILDFPTDETEPMVLLQTRKAAASNPQTFYVKKTVLLDQTALQSAFTSIDTYTGKPQINLIFTDKGKELFSTVTRDYSHKSLAMVIAGQVYTILNIGEPVASDRTVITGAISEQETQNLVARITESLIEH